MVIRDLKNYFDLRKITKKESKNSPIWVKHGLRIDWLGRIYTVFNLPPEVTLSPDIPKESWIAYVIEHTKPLNEYLTSLNLQEILVPDYRLIPGTESYLLIYKPFFQEFSMWWILSRLIFWCSVFFIQHKFHLFTNLYSWVQHLF